MKQLVNHAGNDCNCMKQTCRPLLYLRPVHRPDVPDAVCPVREPLPAERAAVAELEGVLGGGVLLQGEVLREGLAAVMATEVAALLVDGLAGKNRLAMRYILLIEKYRGLTFMCFLRLLDWTTFPHTPQFTYL